MTLVGFMLRIELENDQISYEYIYDAKYRSLDKEFYKGLESWKDEYENHCPTLPYLDISKELYMLRGFHGKEYNLFPNL